MVDALFGNPLVVLFATIGLGMALGKVSVGGISFGSSAVLFVALLMGHLGYVVPAGAGQLGLVLFVYAVGIGAGARFFTAIARQGSSLALVSLAVVLTGGAIAVLGTRMLGLPTDLGIGIFAGALTSTPALAAASDALGGAATGVSIGYGIAYPFGIIGVVLFVQLLPRLLKVDLAASGAEVDRDRFAEDPIVSRVVTVESETLSGKRISDAAFLAHLHCQVTRVVKDGRPVPLNFDDCFEKGAKLILVGKESEIDLAVEMIGKGSTRDEAGIAIDADRERRMIVVTASAIAGKRLADVQTVRDYRVVISRITRLGVTFVPTADTVIERNDQLTTVGSPDDLSAFAEAAGHRSQYFEETDLLSLGFGLTAGVLLGMISITLPGMEALSLGLAGGPLIAGLVLGHFGRVGRIIGHIPRPTRMLLQEFGLVLFLADAGMRGGQALAETVATYGLAVFAMGAAVTVVPLLVGFVVARVLLKISLLEALGGICGGMTSTPALGALTAKTNAQAPIVSYATAYPVALILMTLIIQPMARMLGL